MADQADLWQQALIRQARTLLDKPTDLLGLLYASGMLQPRKGMN